MSDSVWCVGCNRYFADQAAFELHATGQRKSLSGTPRRCRPETELRSLGMKQLKGTSTWAIGVKPKIKS